MDKAPFRDLMKYLRPSLRESDMPHRTKTHGEIMDRAQRVVDRIKEKLQVCCAVILRFCSTNLQDHLQHVDSKVSMTFDSWTSLNGDPFLSITGHYIDSPQDNPHQWRLKTEQLAFSPIEGNHSGQNIGRILLEAIEAYGLADKVCTELINLMSC